MAENVAVTTLEIRGTEKVATSMKELKQQITDYRNQLVALGQIEDKTEEQMEQQTRVIEKLRKATKLLSDVTNAHKNAEGQLNKAIDLNTGSYNELQAEMTRLKKLYKDMSAMERDSEFGQETLQTISQLDVKLKELDAGMGQYQRNVGNYGQTFEESMAQARQSSGYLAQGMGTLNGILALSGTENEGLKKAVTGVTLALQVMQNEGVSKLLIKLKDMISAKMAARAASKAQAAEAKATAVAMNADTTATQAATTATNGFKKALIATGIGAIIVLIGTLIAHWDDLKDAIGGTSDEAQKRIDDLKKQMEELAETHEQTMARMMWEGKSQGEIILEEYSHLSELQELQRQVYNELIKDNSTAVAAWWNSDEIDEAMDAYNEKSADLTEKLKEGRDYLFTFLAEQNKEIADSTKNAFELLNAEAHRKLKEMSNLANALLAEALITDEEYFRILDQLISYGEYVETKIADLKAQADKEIAEIQAKRAKEKEDAEAARLKQLSDLEAYEQDIEQSLEDEYWMIMEKARLAQEAREQEEKLRQEKMDALHEETIALADEALEQIAIREEQLEKEKQIAEQRRQIVVDSATQTAEATSSILGSIADTIEALSADQDAAAKRTKGIRIAATTIDTISGATGAYMQAVASIPPPAGIIVGATQAASVLATGLANIAKMKATSTLSSAMPSFSSSASVTAPSVPTQLESVRNLTSASEEERLNRMAQSQKVYILQSDIEAAGAASKVQVTESTF